MFETVGSKLYTLVNGTVAGNALEFVYNYEKKIGDGGYPYATIVPTESQEQVYSTIENEVQIAYDINIYVRNDTIASNETTLRQIVDNILYTLRRDEYLTGTALKSSFKIRWGYINDEQPIRLAQITATYTLLVSIL